MWTHGSLVQRSLSGVTRAELVRHGFAVLGRPPAAVLPEMTDDDVRLAARARRWGERVISPRARTALIVWGMHDAPWPAHAARRQPESTHVRPAWVHQ